MQIKGTVFNIQRYSIHDGHGIRTTVFLKGCPLRCSWCSNPESQSFASELFYLPQHCIGCGACVKSCSRGVLTLEKGKVIIDRGKCAQCFRCVSHCGTEALQQIGKIMTSQQVIDQVIRDYPMYEVSGGGLTLSGGEATNQPEFALAILRLAEANGIDSVLETCGAIDYSELKAMVGYCSQVLYDIKLIDSQEHKRHVGSDNRIILANAHKLADYPKVVFRFPVIPLITGTRDNIIAVALFLRQIGREEVVLIPYHEYGVEKYRYLSRPYHAKSSGLSGDQCLQEAEEIFLQYGISTSRA